ncbi:MAG TPA: adenylate/guanylate cyclase domain-containing protein [Roseiarcus sp.]|nr:adenylate/guanylate cyclase domain-containing protein [Roseiarcus sp.]
MAQRNAKLGEDRRIDFRVGIHLGDVIVQADGDLMGDGVNIAARLEGIAKPGAICLSEDAYRQVRDKIAAEFTDLGDKELKNIARPMRAYAVQGSETTKTPTHQGFAPSPGASPSLSPVSLPQRLSIVVLPFANLGGDLEQEYFVDGVTESLTTDLSPLSGMLVIGRNTAFTYNGKAVELKQIGRELNVRYVLEGSVQRGGNRMRVNVQLVDAETGNHLWADRFDKPVADLFDMQDEIVARLANTLNTQLVTAEARRAERAPDPDSMDLYFQGSACANKGYSPENIARARVFYERALALDPGNVDPLILYATTDTITAIAYYSDDRGARLLAAEEALTRALSIAPEHAFAHLQMGIVQIFTNRAARGIAECERALALDRNLAFAHGFIGIAKYFIGRSEETEAHVQEAIRLSPRDTVAYLWLGAPGFAKISLGADEEAVAWLRRSTDANRNFPLYHFFLAAALGQLGRLDEARSAVQAGLALNPTFTISRFRAGAPSDNPTFLAQRERIYEGMRKAGVPEE